MDQSTSGKYFAAKNAIFFVRQKVQISSQILPQIPNFANLCHPKMSRV